MAETEIRVPSGLNTEGLLGRRYLARFVDSFLVLALIFGAASALRGVFAPLRITNLNAPAALPLVLIVWIGYGAILESSPLQSTLGKRLMGLRVYDSTGSRLTLTQAASRNLIKDGPFIVLGAIPGTQLLSFGWFCAHLIVIHRSPVSQAIHDRVAHSWVAAPEQTIRLGVA